MSALLTAPAGTGKIKPLAGDPCNRCGMCCFIGPCVVAHDVLELESWSGRCPALEFHDGEFGCGFVLDPLKYDPDLETREPVGILRERAGDPNLPIREVMKIAIGAGVRCDAQDFPDGYTFRRSRNGDLIASDGSSIEVRYAARGGPHEPK